MRRADALLLLALLIAGAAHARTRYELRYGFEPGQSWQAVQTVASETRVGDVVGHHSGTARIRYEVTRGALPDQFRLDARMLSQQTAEGESPLDFSAIQFVAQTDARGVTRGKHFQLGDAEPPELEGVEPDPVAYRQMLRSLAAAWLESIYWLPELPEGPLSVGESFELADQGEVGGTDPGVSMEMRKQTTYRLAKVSGRLAEFDIEVRSTVDASTAQSGITSNLTAEGEAVFDLERGMWLRQQIRSQHAASLRGAESGAESASARTVTTIEMEPLGPGAGS